MKKNKVQDKFVEEIEKVPIISIACEKVDISRNTFYRWASEDGFFAARVSDALTKGSELVSDIAESNVLNGIKNKDLRYTMYWLSHRNPKYRRHVGPEPRKERMTKQEYEAMIAERKESSLRFQAKWFPKPKKEE